MAVKIVTDSTADIPAAMASNLDISVVPLNVHFGAESLRDGVDLTTDGFFVRLPQSPVLPTTSQPSPGAFLETYTALLDAGHDVLSVHISAKLSGTMNSALLAQRELPAGAPLEIVDTGFTSMALGMAVIEAARAAQSGAGLAEAAAVARRTVGRTHLLMFLETLEYLQKGGRIGKAQALLGSLLSFKPILAFKNSEVLPAGRIRTRGKAIDHLV
ncbi:MAG: DegV family protein, partial [Chloroflexi bacterium]|nr:DegV family protein [Chloroflexota bacterium]